MPLFWRIFLLNALVLLVAAALLLGPVTVSTPVRLEQVGVLAAGVAAALVANAVLLGVALGPLRRLTRAMSTADLLHEGPRLDAGGPPETAELITAFNTMIDRLKAERATGAGVALAAQEAERQRIARELHDEVGQTLTAVLLELKRVADRAPPPLDGELRQVQETTRAGLDEIRRIARRLRPGVLEELGLPSALRALAAEAGGTGFAVRHRVDADLPPLGHAAELVVYRVAQEGLTNATRHSGARHARVELSRVPQGVRLRVSDDGRGIGGAPEGAGIRGMRERTALVGGTLDLRTAPGGGTELRLTVPTEERPR